jgi:imidazolonepropionase-like amidohydrolase
MIEELKKEKYPCIVGPNLTDRSKIELKNLSFKNPGILSKNGIMVALMTDHPVVPLQYLILCAALSVKEGMDEYEALKAITINPAVILGINDRVGSIEKGKDADIVIMNGHPFDTFSTTEMVIVDGEIAYEASKQ